MTALSYDCLPCFDVRPVPGHTTPYGRLPSFDVPSLHSHTILYGQKPRTKN